MIPGDQDERRIGQLLAKPLELTEGEDDREIGRPDGVEQVSHDDHRIGAGGHHGVHRGAERVGDVGLALVDAGRGLTVVLPEAEVEVGEVGDLHGWRMGPTALVLNGRNRSPASAPRFRGLTSSGPRQSSTIESRESPGGPRLGLHPAAEAGALAHRRALAPRRQRRRTSVLAAFDERATASAETSDQAAHLTHHRLGEGQLDGRREALHPFPAREDRRPGELTKIGWVKCGCRSISSPLGKVASLILVAGERVPYPGVASSSESMRP